MVSAQETDTWSSSRPDGHAPIHIMGDHMHSKGEFMFSYRFMTMNMDGILSKSSEIQNAVVFENYMAAPQKMTMDMHMLGFMYAPSNQFTMLLMVNYLSNSMDLTSKMNVGFETQSSGLGDLTIGGLVHLISRNQQKLHANFGVSIPTGGLNQRGDTPMMMNTKLAYPMQLGSGTWDPYFGVTYLGQTHLTSWGLQTLSKFRLGDNANDYSLGNRLSLSGWYALKVSNNLSFSGSLEYVSLGGIKGKDMTLNPIMMPLFSTKNSGRNQLDFGLGSNYLVSKGAFKNMRVAVELIVPLSQSVEGIQMKNGLTGVIGIQYAFHSH